MDDWRLRLLCMVDRRRRMLPTPDLRFPPASSCCCCNRGGGGRMRGFVGVGRFWGATPAVKVISSRNVSRSEANLRRAFSKSWSLRPEPPTCRPFIVALLLLLAVCFSGPTMVLVDWRCSEERCVGGRAAAAAAASGWSRPSCDFGRMESVSSAQSSSMVSTSAGGGTTSGDESPLRVVGGERSW